MTQRWKQLRTVLLSTLLLCSCQSKRVEVTGAASSPAPKVGALTPSRGPAPKTAPRAELAAKPAGSVVVMAAGDIQNGAWSADATFEKTAEILDRTPYDFIVGLGDMSNTMGTTWDYAQFDRAWGRHKAKLFAVAGSHDYGCAGGDSEHQAIPFYDYFNGPGNPAGVPSPGCHTGPRGKGYFSLDLGPWLLIGLNYCADGEAFSADDAQMKWLAQVMTAKPRGKPVLVIAHPPRYTKATNHQENEAQVSVAWGILLAHRPDVRLYLCGHMNGIYERWVPMNNERQPDRDGIRSFTVGTGGQRPYGAGQPDELLERTAQAHGLLKLTLRPRGYDWEFKPIASVSFTDSGSTDF